MTFGEYNRWWMKMMIINWLLLERKDKQKKRGRGQILDLTDISNLQDEITRTTVVRRAARDDQIINLVSGKNYWHYSHKTTNKKYLYLCFFNNILDWRNHDISVYDKVLPPNVTALVHVYYTELNIWTNVVINNYDSRFFGDYLPFVIYQLHLV